MAMATNVQCKGILFLGLVCEDIICSVSEYPKEDDKIRCSSSALRVGGNARNSAVVLSLLNQRNVNKIDIYCMASLSSVQRSAFVVSDLHQYGINTDLCPFYDTHEMTVSYIIVSAKTKSRTIINYPCLKPLSFEAFMEHVTQQSQPQAQPQGVDNSVLLKSIDTALQFIDTFNAPSTPVPLSRCILDDIQAIHIEARWIKSMMQILGYIRRQYPSIFISIEIEKERLYDSDDARNLGPQSDAYPVNDLISFADLVFFSRQLVRNRGYAQEQTDHDNTPKQFIEHIIEQYGKNRVARPLTVVVPWGETGAYGARYDCSLALYDESYQQDIEVQFSPSFPPQNVVDTIGAGDTFNGAYLSYAMKNNIWKYDVAQCLQYACKVAGYKVGYEGFDCVENFV